MDVSPNLLGSIINAAVFISRSIGAFLAECDRLEAQSTGSSRIATCDPIQLLSEFGNWRGGQLGLAAALEHVPYVDTRPERAEIWERRLASATINLWSGLSARSAKRPDVLYLTATLLANANAGHTYPVVRYSICSALRSLYRIWNEEASLADLWTSYRNLSSRIAGQKRRRVLKRTPGAEPFLIDLLCMNGDLYRSATQGNLASYYEGFVRYPLGVDFERRIRHFSNMGHWPEIHGMEPDFSTVLNIAFSQPTGIPGLDEVTGGLMPTMGTPGGFQPGGLITLLAGPPGSGKTTLAMSIVSRMRELGSDVTYVSVEEGRASLQAKKFALVDTQRLAQALWPNGDVSGLVYEFSLRHRDSLGTLGALVDQIESQLKRESNVAFNPGEVSVGFRHVIVIDSITVLLGDSLKPGHQAAAREELAGQLNRLRQARVCVFLVGERTHADDHHLAYLVDNVFLLDFEEEPTSRHPVRVFSIEKTRLQISFRGRHVFHLSRHLGPTISPSLHAVLRMANSEGPDPPGREPRSVLWARSPKQTELAFVGTGVKRPTVEAITLRNRSHSLVYGWGTTGKARLALSLAFEPQLSNEDLVPYIEERASRGRSYSSYDKKWFQKARVLVVSYLYGREYYEGIASELIRSRFEKNVTDEIVSGHLSVEDLYPGYLDPETLVNRVRNALRGARQEGRPFTTVVIDGIHNMLLQFPLLTREPLLWPTMFRVLKSESVNAVSTFTFFEIASAGSSRGEESRELPMLPNDAEKMFHHLLVSNCDYALFVSRVGAAASRRTSIKVARTTSVDGFGREPAVFFWDSDELECVVE